MDWSILKKGRSFLTGPFIALFFSCNFNPLNANEFRFGHFHVVVSHLNPFADKFFQPRR